MSLTTAIVHIDVEADLIPEAAEAIVNIDGVTEVYSITGDWDLIAMVRVSDHEKLAEIIPNRISKVDGVIRTETQLAFRAYSRHDLEAAFSLGLD
ncbi:AsnC family transcriptional regulator [Corynebacterium xerosis]|jgi:DNA-binding Lrp family transcriptional regulator|uniref:AsnC family transcriptional regulator n=1 Tax=Corynebacterium xerosis TaxID=1725 RepID=A0A0M2XKP9_9CORY|nr:Lrp/AsnC family transcriptional regulator [Corynebacterium xerosis]KKO82363.1 AsnC family transcriptional regulator [Corynebacterium xerosis]NMF08059.1 Lrp/AsnC family transcriptional regulator [Corynebacterium xerosis]PMC61313.1 AsnC family transcriptional regulator [Corynebacterium xerosis]SQB96345.1 AsnC family [Clostridium paraputrificum]